MTQNRGGRPPHVPTPDQRKKVRALVIADTGHEEIAAIIGVAKGTLTKHYAAELTTAKAEANARVVANLYRQATKDAASAVPAAIHWTKTQLGWKEPIAAAASRTSGKKQAAADRAQERALGSSRFAVPPPPSKPRFDA
jgi:hypothetical protein